MTYSQETFKNKMNAHVKGKRVMVSIPNPDKSQTNKPFIRVTSQEAWGDYNRAFHLKTR